MIDPGWVALGTEVPTVFKMNFAFFKLQNKKASVHLLKNDKKEIGNQLIWGGFVVDLRVGCNAMAAVLTSTDRHKMNIRFKKFGDDL